MHQQTGNVHNLVVGTWLLALGELDDLLRRRQEMRHSSVGADGLLVLLRVSVSVVWVVGSLTNRAGIGDLAGAHAGNRRLHSVRSIVPQH